MNSFMLWTVDLSLTICAYFTWLFGRFCSKDLLERSIVFVYAS